MLLSVAEPGAVELDAGAHGAGKHEGLDVGALCSSGLGLDDGVHKGVEVLNKLILAEACLADGAVADVGLINTILDLTGFDIGNGLSHVHGNGAALGVRHQALGAEHTTDAADNAHHIGGGYADVETEPVLGLDLLDQILIAYEIGAGFLSLTGLIALGKNQNADYAAGAVGQYDCAANLLISVTGVNAQADVSLDGLIKLGLGGGQNGLDTLGGIVKLLLVDILNAFVILLTVLHSITSSVYYNNAHAAGGAGYHAHGSLDGTGVKVGHLELGDLADLSLGDIGDLGLVGNAGAALYTAGLLDKNGCGRGLGDKGEGTVLINGDNNGDYQTGLLGGALVELLAEAHDVNAVLTQSGTNGRCGCSFTCRDLQLDKACNFLCHFKFPPKKLWYLRSCGA